MIKKPFQEQLSECSLLEELPKVETGLEESWENLKKCTEPFTAKDIIKQQQEIIESQKVEIKRLEIVHKYIDEVILVDEEFAIADEYLIAYQHALKQLYDNTKSRYEVIKEFESELREELLGCDRVVEGYVNRVTGYEIESVNDAITNIVTKMIGENK